MKKKNKDYSKIPTHRLKTLLNERFTRGVNGNDYQDVKSELEGILWERMNKESDALVKEYERQCDEYFEEWE